MCHSHCLSFIDSSPASRTSQIPTQNEESNAHSALYYANHDTLYYVRESPTKSIALSDRFIHQVYDDPCKLCSTCLGQNLYEAMLDVSLILAPELQESGLQEEVDCALNLAIHYGHIDTVSLLYDAPNSI